MKWSEQVLLRWSRTGLAKSRFGIGWLFVAALTPGVLSGAILLNGIYQNQRTQLEQGALYTSRALALAVDRDLAGIQGKLQILATSPFLQSGDFPALYRQSQEVLGTESLAGAVVLIDSKGQQVMNTLRPLGAELPKTGHPDMLRRTFESGRPTVSDLYIGGVARRHFVALEVPVWLQGKVVFGLDMGIPPERLNQVLVAQNLPEGWVATLLDSQGAVVARTQNAARSVGQKATADLLEQMGQRNEGSLASHTLEGVPSFVAFSRSASSGWTVAVAMRRDVLYRSLYAPLALTALAMAAFIAMSVALALLFSRHVRQALQKLGAATDAAAAGDMGAVAPLVGTREIMRLAAQFNSMQEARRSAQAELQIAASVFSEASEGIIIADRDAQIIDVNRAFTELTGYARSEVVGRNPRILQSGRQDAAFYATMWQSLRASGRWQGEIWNRRKDGSLFAGHMTIRAVQEADGMISRYISLFSDVTEKMRQQEEIESLAYYDPLTHLPNRRLLSDRIIQAQSYADRQQTLVALCYLDLDGFKPINDTWGHEAGDRVLVEIARRLQETIRSHDTVARLGGDEFVVLLTNLGSQDESDVILNRVLQVIAEPISLENSQLAQISASIGVAIYPWDGRDPDSLLRHGDQAMYQAKQAGRNRIKSFEPSPESVDPATRIDTTGNSER